MATVKNDKTHVGEVQVNVSQSAPPMLTALSVTRTYRDELYSSRTLILPDDRTLLVVAGRVTVPADDTTALDYLNQHPDFEPLE
ncbi:hypothetical protein PS634_01808 [Pseudomonas fluorescens]|nr:hypothetical protein PS634_01808 [Pseudomonas fluorescens]